MRREGFVVLCMTLALSPLAHAAPDDPRPTPWMATAGTPTEVPAAATSDPQEFGTATDSVVTVMTHDFWLGAGSEGPINPMTGTRSCSAGPCVWAAGAQLPTGAQIRGVELSACDLDPVQQVQFWITTAPKVPGQAVNITPVLGTGGPNMPGCTTVAFSLPGPVTVQNDVTGYGLVVQAFPGTNVEWNQFRVRYRLQVSPAPGTATFPNDVPTTHPFFRFIEALAAAGVTGGCGASSYCPDAAVTRGQMAVFLATALGLHFPN